MINLNFDVRSKSALEILCLGAHSDDIEIGCGGTLLQFKKTYKDLRFHWVVFSAAGVRKAEASKGAELFTAGSDKNVILKDFRDGFLPYSGADVKGFFEELKASVNPDLIFTHCQGDAHQDHRLDRRVSVGRTKTFDDPFGNSRTERIDRRIVDDDDADIAVFLKADHGIVGHGGSSLLRAAG